MKDFLHRMNSAPRAPRRDAVRCEIEVALRFIEAGSRVRAEVTGPQGRSVDLEVHSEDRVFAVHVKRLSERTHGPTRPPATPPSLNSLASDPPSLRRRRSRLGADHRAGRRPSSPTARDFLRGCARIGDRHVLRDAGDRRRGGPDGDRRAATGPAERSDTTPGVEARGGRAKRQSRRRPGRPDRTPAPPRLPPVRSPGRENVIVLDRAAARPRARRRRPRRARRIRRTLGPLSQHRPANRPRSRRPGHLDGSSLRAIENRRLAPVRADARSGLGPVGPTPSPGERGRRRRKGLRTGGLNPVGREITSDEARDGAGSAACGAPPARATASPARSGRPCRR